jgi:hypothetical protein
VPGPSTALQHFPEQLREEYDDILGRMRGELSALEGLPTIHGLILERFVFLYTFLRYQEINPETIDPQRYNQLFQIWNNVAKDTLVKYKELVEKGALRELFVQKIMTIVGEEVDDGETLARIRGRLISAAREDD